MFHKILIPIDADEPAISEQGALVAAELSTMEVDGAIAMIHVLPELPMALADLVPALFESEHEKTVESQLRAMATKAKIPAGRVSFVLRKGTVYHEVLAEAEAIAADLIIVGSRSPSLATHLLGSNAEKIVQNAKCSVLVVRPRKDEQGLYWLIPPIAS
jgi:nucleotide-binding universal stress UspA family protein